MSSGRSFMVDPLSYFSFQAVLHDWCNKGHGMCYPVCGMVNILEPLLLIGKSNPCSGGSGFPLSLSESFFIICPSPYNGQFKNVWSASLKNISFLLSSCFGLFHLLRNILKKEGNVLFNNTFYLRLYGVRHMVKDHSDSEKGNPLPPHRLLLSINSKGSFICTIPQTG